MCYGVHGFWYNVYKGKSRATSLVTKQENWGEIMTIDLEIARAANLKPITDISGKLGIPDDAVLQHGPHIAKVSLDYCEKGRRKAERQADPRHRDHPHAER